MTPLAIQTGDILPQHLLALALARVLLDQLPGSDRTTCHSVCDILAQHAYLRDTGFVHVRGRFNHFDHSWLEIEADRVILDPYPWMCGSGPILLTTNGAPVWRTLYVPDVEATTGA